LTHRNYGNANVASEECRGTINGRDSFKVEVKTNLCNFRTHAVPPNKKEGTVDIVCAEPKRSSKVTEKSNIIKGLTTTLDIIPNAVVTGTKIPAGTTVTKVINEKEVEISNLVEGVGTAEVTETVT